MERARLGRSENFALALFGAITVAIVLPGVVLIAVSLFSTGSIYIPHDLGF